MKFYGEANLQQNFLRDAVIPLDTAFPASPVVGHITFKDRILYICVEIVGGTPIWVPLTNEITSYTHLQNTSSDTWVINHTLNTAHVSVTVYDDQDRVIIPDYIQVTGASQVVVGVSLPAQGKVVVVTGHFEGNQKPTYAYEHLQTSPSATWVIPHLLGRFPVVRVFVGNQEVQPASIVFDNLNQVTVTFSSALAGEAKLI